MNPQPNIIDQIAALLEEGKETEARALAEDFGRRYKMAQAAKARREAAQRSQTFAQQELQKLEQQEAAQHHARATERLRSELERYERNKAHQQLQPSVEDIAASETGPPARKAVPVEIAQRIRDLYAKGEFKEAEALEKESIGQQFTRLELGQAQPSEMTPVAHRKISEKDDLPNKRLFRDRWSFTPQWIAGLCGLAWMAIWAVYVLVFRNVGTGRYFRNRDHLSDFELSLVIILGTIVCIGTGFILEKTRHHGEPPQDGDKSKLTDA